MHSSKLTEAQQSIKAQAACQATSMDWGQTDIQEPIHSLRAAVRLSDVLNLLGGIGRSTLFAMLNPKSPTFDPDFPKPFKLGKACRSPNVWWHWQIIRYLQLRSGQLAAQ